jgi:hypothetical protein
MLPGVRLLRRCHRPALLMALVGLMLASALVAVGAHEHDLWGGDTPEGVVCVVDHDGGDTTEPSTAGGGASSQTLGSSEAPHRHLCVGFHATSHPPAVHRDRTPQAFDTASRTLPIALRASAELRSAHAFPAPRGPPAA